MKIGEVKFVVTTKENGGVGISYQCLYTHPKFSKVKIQVTTPGQSTTFFCGSVKYPEWAEFGHVFLHGTNTEDNNKVTVRNFVTEAGACTALWQALYGLLTADDRAVVKNCVPADAPDHLTTIVINGKELKLDNRGVEKFIATMR